MILPPELIRSIVEQVVHASDLVVLSRASRHLQEEAERLLYRSMTSIDGTTSFEFLSSIQNCPRRARSVHIHHVHGIPHKQLGSIRNLIPKCLRAMVNLKELGSSNYLLYEPAVIFPATCPFRLEKFIWRRRLLVPSVYDEQAIAFLEGQPQLRHLRWMTTDLICPLKTLCPNLRILEGDIHTFQMFLPGRSVTTLYWLFDRTIWNDVFPDQKALQAISPQLKMIRALSYRIPHWAWIEMALGHLESLEALEVFSQHYMDAKMARLLHRDMPPKLKTLIISPTEKWARERIGIDFVDKNVKTASLIHPSLKRVYLAINNFPEDEPMYKAWINAVAQPDLVDTSEARSDFV